MDELKLEKWKRDFSTSVGPLQLKYDSFFQDSELDDNFNVELDDTSQNLTLKLTNPQIPERIKNELIQIFYASKPEDSV